MRGVLLRSCTLSAILANVVDLFLHTPRDLVTAHCSPIFSVALGQENFLEALKVWLLSGCSAPRSRWIGRFFEPLGIKIAFTPVGIWIALVVVSLPFIVRAVQWLVVLEELSGD